MEKNQNLASQLKSAEQAAVVKTHFAPNSASQVAMNFTEEHAQRNQLITLMIASAVNFLLEQEVDALIAKNKVATKDEQGNDIDHELALGDKRNGYSHKLLNSCYGYVQIKIPRNRLGHFEPKIVAKFSRQLPPVLEQGLPPLFVLDVKLPAVKRFLVRLYGTHFNENAYVHLTEAFYHMIRKFQSNNVEELLRLGFGPSGKHK